MAGDGSSGAVKTRWIVADSVSGSVTIRLRHVDPLDALFTAATLKGADARLENGVVVVKRGAAR